jgi:hypothetical protein
MIMLRSNLRILESAHLCQQKFYRCIIKQAKLKDLSRVQAAFSYNGSLNVAYLCLPQAVSRQPLTAKVRVRSEASPCEICNGGSGTGTGFVLSTSVVRCQYQCRCFILIHSLTTDAT